MTDACVALSVIGHPTSVIRLRSSVLGLLLLLSGCAYYNGLYNAKVETRAADRLSRQGRDAEAMSRYATAAAKAETVLVRYPKSRWRPQALTLAGRTLALSGDCLTARPRLGEALALTGLDAEARDQLLVAQAACDVRDAHPAQALRALEPLAARGHPSVRPSAALWAVRAAIALGDAEHARTVLGPLDASAAQWELAQAALSEHRYAVAESLLTLRAARGDVRPDATPLLRTFWVSGQPDAVERLVNRWAAADTRPADKLALHMLAASLQIGAGLDVRARAHLLAVRRLATDSVTDGEAAAQLTLISLASLSRPEDVAASVRRNAHPGRTSSLQRRLEDNVVLVEMLANRPDASGASLYLAAEVARDSLRAPRLAVQLFKRIDQTVQGALLAPRGLATAASLDADSSAAVRARLRERYPRSPWTMALDGANPGDFPAYEVSEATLRVAWRDVALQFADSLTRLRAPNPPAAAKRPTRPVRKPKGAPSPASGAGQ